ncbi:MAG: T9SS type A sorting domain-containing protein [Fimbriimonadaceae bacterium]|nr:T9SS type A sorting domain-containing protein [Chitinophagales bacterium]
MKRFLSTTIFGLLITLISYAQPCTVDASCTSGICPDSITNLPVTADNVTSYSTTVTVVVPKDTTDSGFTLKYKNITLNSVSGLPPGFTYTCNPATCVFPGNAKSCIKISGNPSTAGAGTYNITAYVTAKLTHWLLGTIYVEDSVTYLRIQIDPVVICENPMGLTSTDITATAATLNWSDEGATNYKLKYRLSTSTIWTTVNTTSTSYTLTGLSVCTQYKWNVTAICPTGNFKSGTKTFNTTGCRLSDSETFVDTDEDLLMIHPNPAKENLFVNYISSYEKEQQVMIVDMNGRIMMSEMHVMFEGENNFELQINNLTPGIYLLKVFDGAGEYITKFVKE